MIALRLAAQGAQASGADVKVVNVARLDLPAFDPSCPYDQQPESALQFVATIRWADCYLWASPAYHGSMSGVLKNALDYVDLMRNDTPPFLTGRPVGIITVGSGAIGVVNATTSMVLAANALRAFPLPLAVSVGNANSCFAPDGTPLNGPTVERLQHLALETIALTRRLICAPHPPE
jgi:FMN reductase